jgi:hypothetical protein
MAVQSQAEEIAMAETVAPSDVDRSPCAAANGKGGDSPSLIVRLLPSVTDVAFLMPLMLLFGPLHGAKTLLGDADTGWQLRTGQWILEHGRVPSHDIFSYTKAGQPWFAWEWLWDLTFGWLHLHWGLAAVVLVNAVLLGVVFALLYRLALWKSRNVFVAIAVTLAAAAGSSSHWFARPHLFTWLFLVVFYWLLERGQAGRTRALLWLPALMVLWTNLHGGFITGVVLVGAYAAGELVSWAVETGTAERARAWANACRYALLTVACAAASLINPYGYKLHVHIARYLSDQSLYSGIAEFMAFSFQGPTAMYVEAMILLGAVAAAWNVYHRRFVYPILLLVWIHAGLFSRRNTPLFLLVAAPLVASTVADLLGAVRGARVAEWIRKAVRSFAALSSEVGEMERIGRVPLVAAAAVLMMAGLFRLEAGDKFRADFSPKLFPVKAAGMLNGPRYASGVFSIDQWGSYLIYRYYPNFKVFIDDRSDFYGSRFGDQYIHVTKARWDWEKVLDGYHVSTVLLPANLPVNSVLKQSSRWRLVYDDHFAVLFERTAGGQQAAVQALGQGKRSSAAESGGLIAIARSRTLEPVVHGSQSYARRN